MMTRKDYEMLARSVFRPHVDNARTLRRVEDAIGAGSPLSDASANVVQSMAYSLVQQLAADNSRFDHIRFYEACGFKVEHNYPQVFDTETN